MRINLIPDELRPTRTSPVPYMPLIGLAAIGLIWLVTQFAGVASTRKTALERKQQLKHTAEQLAAYRDLPGRITHAENESEALMLRAAAATVLTRRRLACTPLLQAVADAASENLRLTLLSVDFAAGEVMLQGYGSEDNAEIEVASFVRRFNQNKMVLKTFLAAELNYCTSRQRGDMFVKQFAITIPLREADARPADDRGREAGRG